MKHVFLSYSRKDARVMERIRDDLTAAGLPVWTDSNLTPGTPSWKNAIEKAIENAAALVVILSPDAKQSEWVECELDYAATCRIPIYPVLARGDERGAVPLELINVQRVDIRDRYDPVTERLIPALRNLLGVQAPARAEPARPAPVRRDTRTGGPGYYSALDRSLGFTEEELTLTNYMPELGESLGFTEEELKLNRQNRLSKRQKEEKNTVIRLLVIWACLFLFVGGLPANFWLDNIASRATIHDIIETPLVMLPALLGIVTAFPLAWLAFKFQRRPVRTATGQLSFSYTPSRSFIHIGSLSFRLRKGRSLPKDGWGLNPLHSSEYRLYYIGYWRIRQFLSIEPVPTPGRSRQRQTDMLMRMIGQQ